jgi:hypothetical protein
MICIKCGWRSAAAFSAAVLCSPLAFGQNQPVLLEPPVAPPPVTPVNVAGPGAAEGNAAKDVQAASQNIFRLANSAYSTPSKLGYGSGNLTVGIPLRPIAESTLPLTQWGGRPEDAEIKLGNFYLDVISLSGAVLWTDNANQTETNRKSGAISIVQLKFALVWQVLENFRLAAASAVTWLPFENKIGVTDPFADLDLNAGLGPQALFELTYDVPLGGWDLLLYDRFSASRGLYGLRENIDLLGQDNSFIEDRIGRYSFREDLTRRGSDSHGLLENRLSRVTEYRNSVGFTLSRVVPTETEVTLFGNHDNSWYSGDSTGLANSRDTLGVLLESVRENMRFKPFFKYTASKSDIQREWDHLVEGGVKGPITDYIDFLGDAGYNYIGDTASGVVTWRLRLEHNPRPSTVHSIEYRRYVTFPDRDLATTLTYRLRQGIGPYMSAGLAFERATFEDLDNNNTASTEYRAEALLDFQLSSRSNLRLLALYSDIKYVDPARPDISIFTGRAELNLRHTDTVFTTLLYQYEQRDSSLPGDSYYENLVLLRVTKTF